MGTGNALVGCLLVYCSDKPLQDEGNEEDDEIFVYKLSPSFQILLESSVRVIACSLRRE